LENDLSVPDTEEAAAPETERIAPLEDRPLPVFEEVLGMHTMVARANSRANISRIAVFPSTGVSATW
jgi:hypothetical protein